MRLARLAVAAAVLATAGAASAQERRSLAFPVMIAPAETTQGPVAHNDVPVRQPFRSLRAVRLAAPLSITYRPRVLDRKFTAGGQRTVQVAPDRILVAALDDEGELYCTAATDRPDGMLTFFDVGVCLRDADRDGVFERQLLIEPTSRIRTAYEIAIDKEAAWAPSQAAYAPVPAAEIPAGDVRLVYSYVGRIGLFGIGGEHKQVWVHVCFPEALTLADAGRSQAAVGVAAEPKPGLCGALAGRPSSGRLANIGGGVALTAKPGVEEAVGWGAMAATVTRAPDGKATVTLRSAYPPGPAVLGLAGAWRSTGDYKAQTSLFELRPVSLEPAR
jgi:hypothetical protein